MSEPTVKKYYHYNMPRGHAVIGQTIWSAAGTADVIIQPSADEADYVEYIQLLISDDFAMTAVDAVTLLITAYETTQTLTITSAGVAVADLAALIALGDGDLFESMSLTAGAAKYHKAVIRFKPPVYLRNSTTPAESISLTYAATGGGITAGSMIITTKHWTDEEDSSGL